MEKILSNCYRLPWREDNNPNGWIEPTTFCQLKCPGCYRGVDKKTHRAEHEDLQKMKSHVDWLISNRNIHTLSIAGGDPMVYPFLEELISYAAHKNLRTMVYTNGVDLDEARLFKLKSAGVTQIVIHIDIYQGRKNCATEEQADALREEFCNLFRKVKGVNLGFIQPLSRETLADISKSNAFFVRNRDVINLVVYTLYREIGWKTENHPEITANLKIDEVVNAQIATKAFYPASYLPGVNRTSESAWIFSYSIGTENKILGFLDGRVSKLIHSRYFDKKGRYLFISRSNKIHFRGLLKLLFYKSIAKVLIHPKAWFNKLYFQTFLVIRGPVKNADGWDLCDGCPDAIFDGDKLQPSCILSELEKN